MADEGGRSGSSGEDATDEAISANEAASADETTSSDEVTAAEEAPSGSAESVAESASSAPAASATAESSAGIAGTIHSGAKTVFGPLVASKLRIFLLVVVVLVGLVGLVAIGFALGTFGVPEVAAVENDFGAVTENETVIETNVTVSNPNPVGVSLGGVGIDYHVRMNDVRVANGTKQGVSIESGNSTTHLETVLYNDRIPPWWASHVSNRERTDVVIDAEVSSSTLGQSRTISESTEIETDILGQFASQEDRPIDGNLPVLDDPLLIVEETDASWGNVDREETPLNMAFTVRNPNTEPYAISELRYNISMNHVRVASGATEDLETIEGGSTETLHATTAIQNQRLDDWWVSHLDESVYGHQVTLFRIDFTAVVGPEGGPTVTVPLDDLTYRKWIDTDVLGEGGDVGVPPEAMPDDDGGIVGGGGDGGSGSSDGSGDDGSGDGGSDGGSDDGSTDGGSTDGSDDGGLLDGGDDDDGGIVG